MFSHPCRRNARLAPPCARGWRRPQCSPGSDRRPLPAGPQQHRGSRLEAPALRRHVHGSGPVVGVITKSKLFGAAIRAPQARPPGSKVPNQASSTIFGLSVGGRPPGFEPALSSCVIDGRKTGQIGVPKDMRALCGCPPVVCAATHGL